MTDLLFTQEDADLLFNQPVLNDPLGYVYFDERNGEIKSVSYTASNQPWPYCRVALNSVAQFITGEKDSSRYRVVYHGADPTLVFEQAERLTIKTVADGIELLKCDQSAPLQLLFSIPDGEQHGQITVISPHQQLEFADPILDLIATRAGNPDEIIGTASVQTGDITTGSAEVVFPSPICGEIDLYMRPLSSTGVTINRTPVGDQPLPLPGGRFNDICIFTVVEDGSQKGLLVSILAETIRIELIGGGGRTYDRPNGLFPISICGRDDLERHYASFDLRMEELHAGPVVLPLPPRLPAMVDVVSPLIFEQSQVWDQRHLSATYTAPYRGEHHGILMSINPAMGVISLRCLDEPTDVTISVIEPGLDDILFWGGSFTADEMTSTVTKPGRLPEDFEIRSSVGPVYWEIATTAASSDYIPKRLRTDAKLRGLAFWHDRRFSKLRAQIVDGGGFHLDAEYIGVRLFINHVEQRSFSISIAELQTGQLLGFDISALPSGEMEIQTDGVYSSIYFVE